MNLGDERDTSAFRSRSAIGGFILLFVAVLVLVAGFVYSKSFTLATDSDALLHIQLAGGMSSILAGAIWCGATYLTTRWRREYLVLTILLTGLGGTLVVAGVAALPPFSRSGATLIVITGMGFLLTAGAGVITAARRSLPDR